MSKKYRMSPTQFSNSRRPNRISGEGNLWQQYVMTLLNVWYTGSIYILQGHKDLSLYFGIAKKAYFAKLQHGLLCTLLFLLVSFCQKRIGRKKKGKEEVEENQLVCLMSVHSRMSWLLTKTFYHLQVLSGNNLTEYKHIKNDATYTYYTRTRTTSTYTLVSSWLSLFIRTYVLVEHV